MPELVAVGGPSSVAENRLGASWCGCSWPSPGLDCSVHAIV